MATLDLGKVVPEKGVDYFTNADKEEIKTLTAQQVEEDLDFTETVDTINQNITDLQNTKIDKNVDDLTYYYKSSETYTKTEIDGKISSVYKYKGSVATYADLPSQNNVIGDTYNVEEDGSNYSWNGTGWDKLGGDIDLSDYYTKSQADTLLNGKQNVINSSNKLSADNIDDTLSTQKMTNINEKNAWNAKYDKPSAGIPKNDLTSAVQTSLGLADTAEQPTNKVTSIDENSTDTDYPSAKAVYDIEQAQNTLIDLVRNFVNNYYDIENALPTINQTSTEDIVLNDTMNNAPLKIELASSESTQKTTDGDNIFDEVDFVKKNNAYYEYSNGIKILADDGRSFDNIDYNLEVEANTKYYIKVDNWINNLRFQLFEYSQNMVFQKSNTLTSNNQITTASNTKYLKIKFLADTKPSLIGNALISKKDIDYEPNVSPSPDYPQAINVVTGENEVKIQNKNLFDKNDITNGYLNQDGTINTSSAENKTSGYIKVLPNTAYIRNDINGNVFYDKNKNVLGYVYTNKFTTPENCEYIRITVLINNLNTFQIEKGDIATPVVEHKSQTFLLSLGTLELAKIGEYKDEIFQNTPNSKYYDSSLVADGWYKKKKIMKKIFTGDEEIGLTVAGSSFTYVDDSILRLTSEEELRPILCNYLQPASWQNRNYVNVKNTISTYNTVIGLFKMGYATAEDFKTHLQFLYSNNKPLVVYIPLGIPTNEQITDTTLISQLNAIKNAVSYAGQTNISQTNDKRPFEITVVAKKQI